MELAIIFRSLLALFLLSAVPAAALGAWKLWTLRHISNLIRYKAVLLAAIMIDMVVSIIASSNDTVHLRHNSWFWWWYIPGRILVTCALWILDAVLFGFVRRSSGEA